MTVITTYYARIEDDRLVELHPSPQDGWIEFEYEMGKLYKYEDGAIVEDENREPPPLSEGEVAAYLLQTLRYVRDQKIAETDWWVLPDRTPTQAQLAYRQALRDITETYSSLAEVIWPIKP